MSSGSSIVFKAQPKLDEMVVKWWAAVDACSKQGAALKKVLFPSNGFLKIINHNTTYNTAVLFHVGLQH